MRSTSSVTTASKYPESCPSFRTTSRASSRDECGKPAACVVNNTRFRNDLLDRDVFEPDLHAGSAVELERDVAAARNRVVFLRVARADELTRDLELDLVADRADLVVDPIPFLQEATDEPEVRLDEDSAALFVVDRPVPTVADVGLVSLDYVVLRIARVLASKLDAAVAARVAKLESQDEGSRTASRTRGTCCRRIPSGMLLPTIAPSFTDQSSLLPFQPSRVLPSKSFAR